MFVAGIEIFFGFVAGALLLLGGIYALVKLPGPIWRGMKKVNERTVGLSRGWRMALIFIPIFLSLLLHQEWIAGVSAAFVALYLVNRVIWEFRA